MVSACAISSLFMYGHQNQLLNLKKYPTLGASC